MGCSATKITSAAAEGGGGGSIADEPSSSAASAANGAVSASSANHHQQQQHDRLISAADVPQHLAPTVAEYVRSYSQLEALIDAHPTLRTPSLLLPILIRLLPVVVDVPVPQLALDVAAPATSPHGSALSRFLLPLVMRSLGVLLPTVGLGSFLMRIIPQLPLPRSLSHGCRMAIAIEQLTRRLKRLERGGDWARWRPHLEMLYLLQGRRPVVLGDESFGVFGSRAAFVIETEAVRQWKILSRGVTVTDHDGRHRQVMDGDKVRCYSFSLRHWGYSLPTLLPSASPLFPHVPFDPADPPTERDGLTYRSYTSIMAFVLFCWLRCGGHLPCIRSWISWRRDSAASRRVRELLAASPSDAAQWGAGATVFDRKDGYERHYRLVVLGSEAVGEGHMAVIWLSDREGHSKDVIIHSTEPAPHDRTRDIVMRGLGPHLGGIAWWEE
ncbi:unnamed protein product [Vitrella brassicaformis CCMP3155]|uniref:Uncharacterized protein n=1 Tax=Vitrella brassicaformis (strain CCMP3155) TaxID=1169540 RepID=A0A0G4EH82_VITBC|nr:unnamed protein product [Vitrella brassicaformis CCMP3155]|eukprot:CEL95841.1 unnamed protein product [Vitrella brassicaformis CCMP3155]